MLITPQDITAVILAGGKGSRLGGQDKGLVAHQGKPLIEHILKRIEPQVHTVLINANRNQDVYAQYGYPVISDALNDYQGPLAGISAAMKVAATRYILTLPCDGPSVAKDFVFRMLSAINRDASRIAVAHDGERLQAVHALIPVSLMESLDDFLAKGDRKVGLWHQQHPLSVVDFSDTPAAFANINTEQQRLAMEQTMEQVADD